MTPLEFEPDCRREDKICPAYDLLQDIEDIRDSFALARIALDSVKLDPFSTFEEEKIWKQRRNSHYAALKGSQKKFELITQGKDLVIKLCEICPYSKPA